MVRPFQVTATAALPLATVQLLTCAPPASTTRVTIDPGGPWPTSSLLELGGRTIIIDCGLGVTRGIVDAGLSLKALDLVFVTHLHSDHVLELGPLMHTAWTAGLATPVAVHGPAGTSEYWERFLQSMAFDIDIRIANPPV